MPPPSAPEPAWRQGVRGARANLVPGLVLQAGAILLVVAYYRIPSAPDALSGLTRLRVEGGYLFSFLSTAVFGGLIPWAVAALSPRTRHARPLADLAFQTLYWGLIGLWVDGMYRGLALWLGDSPAPSVVISKVAIDMLVNCTVLTAPLNTAVFAWRGAGFRIGPVRADLDGSWYRRRVWPTLIATWMVWTPATGAIYSMPGPLQVPLLNLVLCFWSLMLATMGRDGRKKE